MDDYFLMPIEDVSSTSDGGTAVTGRIERGLVRVGDALQIVGFSDTQDTTCIGVEMLRKPVDTGTAGCNVKILLRGTERKDVQRGQVLAKAGSAKSHKHFQAQIELLSKEQDGRQSPIFNNFRPQFHIRTAEMTGSIELPKDKEMVIPGGDATVIVLLTNPVAIEEGDRFSFHESGRIVGTGVITKVLPDY